MTYELVSYRKLYEDEIKENTKFKNEYCAVILF